MENSKMTSKASVQMFKSVKIGIENMAWRTLFGPRTIKGYEIVTLIKINISAPMFPISCLVNSNFTIDVLFVSFHKTIPVFPSQSAKQFTLLPHFRTFLALFYLMLVDRALNQWICKCNSFSNTHWLAHDSLLNGHTSNNVLCWLHWRRRTR